MVAGTKPQGSGGGIHRGAMAPPICRHPDPPVRAASGTLLGNPTASTMPTHSPTKPCSKSPLRPRSDFDTLARSARSPKTVEPHAIGVRSSAAAGSALLSALPKHLWTRAPAPYQQLPDAASRAPRAQVVETGQIDSGARQGGRRKSMSAPVSVPRCPLPRVMTMQHSEAETMPVCLLPGTAGACLRPCSCAAQSLKQRVLVGSLRLHHREGFRTLRKCRQPSVSSSPFSNRARRVIDLPCTMRWTREVLG